MRYCTFGTVWDMKRKTTRKKEYTVEVADELDLHGCTASEARALVIEFLEKSVRAEYARVRIVVGKGIHSEGGVPVLPDAVKGILNRLGYDYVPAKIQHGGEGALEVRLP